MTTIFDGKAFAAKKMAKLDKEVAKLKNRGIHLRLASIIVGEDPASMLYVTLKKKKAEAIGAEMDIYYLKEKEMVENILALVSTLNDDPNVYGIMVQLPLPKNLTHEKENIINAILPIKDVDGLREDSPFLHPTSKAVIDVLNEVKRTIGFDVGAKACVIGGTGMVGRPLVKELKVEGYEVSSCDTETKDLEKYTKEADILISCTGITDLIKENMIKKGAILIDVGSPKGDISKECYKKASFATPVPGGIGPITITSLLENLVKAGYTSSEAH